jgi:hypothetical protein
MDEAMSRQNITRDGWPKAKASMAINTPIENAM